MENPVRFVPLATGGVVGMARPYEHRAASPGRVGEVPVGALVPPAPSNPARLAYCTVSTPLKASAEPKETASARVNGLFTASYVGATMAATMRW